MNPKKLERQSLDGSKLNLEARYAIAPSCFTEVQDPKTGEMKQVVNFTTLRTLLGDDAVESDYEMYQFSWPGKQAARLKAVQATNETLRPVPQDSLDWDKTENIYIEGDNLRVLKLLQKSYLGKVKMIYIDPPYNTGKDLVYHDDFSHSATEENLAAGNIDEEGNRFRVNPDTNGRFHSDWCSMMLSRLLVAHSLLSEDGVIFISIDDSEVHNLRKICDEVFGESNFVGMITRKQSSGSKNDTDSNKIITSVDYIIVYAKSEFYFSPILIEQDKKYSLKDNIGNFSLRILEKQGGADTLEERPKMGYSIYYKSSLESVKILFDYDLSRDSVYSPADKNLIEQGYECYRPQKRGEMALGRWRWGYETFLEKFDAGDVHFQNGRVYSKDREKPFIEKFPDALVTDFINTQGTKELKELFESKFFDFPKPISLIGYLLKIANLDKDSLILDFFSGSATTAHAVMQLNAEELKAGKEGKRKYICVQLEEETDAKSEARKAGYNNIPAIAKERIRRAGKKILEENPEVADTLDTGFRVFKLDSSNYEEVSKTPNEYEQAQLDLFLDNIKTDRNDLDLLFGALLSWGVPLSLSQPMATTVVDGCKIYNVTDGELVACFDERITEAVVEAMAEMQPERLLFRDSCFAEDKMKINIFELLKQKLDWDEKEALDNIRVI